VQHEGSSVHLQGGGETRLADARLAREQHHAAVTVFCAIPLAPQQVDLLSQAADGGVTGSNAGSEPRSGLLFSGRCQEKAAGIPRMDLQSSSSNALASFRTGVSNPSVNQP
jgi:hypothetical protein